MDYGSDNNTLNNRLMLFMAEVLVHARTCSHTYCTCNSTLKGDFYSKWQPFTNEF